MNIPQDRLAGKQPSESRGISTGINLGKHGIYTESTKDRLTALERRRRDLDDQIQVESFRHPKLTHEQLEFWFEHMAQMDIRKREQRQRLVDTFINAIFLYDDKLVITFNYQNGTKTLSKEDWLRSDLSGHLRPKEDGRALLFHPLLLERTETNWRLLVVLNRFGIKGFSPRNVTVRRFAGKTSRKIRRSRSELCERRTEPIFFARGNAGSSPRSACGSRGHVASIF